MTERQRSTWNSSPVNSRRFFIFDFAVMIYKEADANSGKASMEVPKVYDSILDVIGKTPLVRMRNIEKKLGLKC
jgi:hypothetical protein